MAVRKMKIKGLIATEVSVGVFSLLLAGCGTGSVAASTTNNESASVTTVPALAKTDFESCVFTCVDHNRCPGGCKKVA